jgi:type II secretory pathway component PulJ
VGRGPKIIFCGGQASAFTLVEVMVTLTIMGFALLMIFGVFRLGIAAWEKGETNKEEYQRTRIASQLISQQMKSAVPYKVKTQKAEGDYLAFEGKARSLKFVSALSLKAKKPSGLVYAFYEFREGENGGGRLMLYEGRVLNKNFLEENPPEDAVVPIFEGLADVRFEYYQEEDPEKNRTGGWVEEWSAKEEKKLPTALRVTLSPQKGGGKTAGVSTVILASLPSNRYEEVRTGPVRRMVPPVTP